ncbi:MAG: hypothetical protein K2M31_08380 [Muribaculaceae bacterium]|nr:hypothetical protein [Muribaculaceae bacterium]
MKTALLFITLIFYAVMSQAQDKIHITVNGVTQTILLSDSEAAMELKNRVNSGDIRVKMNDYGSFEKVGELPWSLPTSNLQISTIPGDVMLYQGNNIVIFYGTNSWSYTPLGKIEGMTPDEIRNFLAGDRIEAILSADTQTGISDGKADCSQKPTVYTLQGIKIDMSDQSLSDIPDGLYLINGKKQLIKH